jgi:hypothetical protein
MDSDDHADLPAQKPRIDAPAPASEVPTGWVPLVRNHWLTDFTVNGFLIIVWLPIFANATQLFTGEMPIVGEFLVWVGVSGLGLIGTLLWFRFRPVLRANFDTSEVRMGPRTIPMREIRWARLLVLESKKSRSITLQFGPGTLRIGAEQGSPWRPTYVVRTVSGQTPPPERARLIAEVLRRSSIELPETPDDPTGKFTWFNFPGSITREQAIDVVLHPPAVDDPLPIPSTHMRDAPRRGPKKKSGPEAEK